MKLQIALQGPVKDWPSLIDHKGGLVARLYDTTTGSALTHAESIAAQLEAARAMLAALELAMPHLAIAKGRGEGVAYDAAWRALDMAKAAGIKEK